MGKPGSGAREASESMTGPAPEPRAADPESVPLFGSWRAIHAAVIVCALLVMALLALFSGWPF
jgi:hypothetical protein